MELNLDEIVMSAENGIRQAFRLGDQAVAAAYLVQINPFFKQVRKYLQAKADPLKPQHWYSRNRIVYQGQKTVLRKFNDDDRGNPLVIVPPEAGHDSLIVDYGPGQSLVECALQNYAGDVYVIEKLPATFRDTGYAIDDSILALDSVVDTIGEPVNFIGFCQGGWQSALYTALYPSKVKALTVAAGPIDFHAGDAKISAMAAALPISFYEQMVMMGGGNMPGAFIVQGFMMMNPVDRFIGDDMNLFNDIDSNEVVKRTHQFQSWYHRYQPVPGKMYLEIVQKLFKDNELIKGNLTILDRMVDLKAIRNPLVLIGGTADDITPPPQVMEMKKYVSSKQIEEIIVPAGHIGVFMGSEIIKKYWPSILNRIGEGNVGKSGGKTKTSQQQKQES